MNNCKGRARGLTSVTTMTTMERAGVADATSEKECTPMNVQQHTRGWKSVSILTREAI